MLMKLVVSFLGVCTMALATPVPSAHAAPGKETLLVSIDKDKLVSCEGELLVPNIAELMEFLAYMDPTMGNEYVQAQIIGYVDFSTTEIEVPYYGVALVEIEYTSEINRAFYIQRILDSGYFTIYSNLDIGSLPRGR
ncbi:MAG: hypothetical protein HC902_11285 [Calothrix sp. SM1_5_4]|nr:hypothetical protein [Calothrix sp. SM1_5_4]